MLPRLIVAGVVVCVSSCAGEERDRPIAAIEFRGDPDGSNCAPAPPVRRGADGELHPLPSVLAHYYRTVELVRVETEGEVLLDTRLPWPHSTDPAYIAWQAKTVEILQAKGEIGFAHHRYYKGVFGLGPDLGAPASLACATIADPNVHALALLAHTALSQAAACGVNTDGTTRFWEVGPMYLLENGELTDARTLIDRGLAMWVTEAPPERCILPARDVIATHADGIVPCVIAFRPDAVTEGVVMAIPSGEIVDGLPVEHRAFTAAGFAPLPNDLASVRYVLRDGWWKVMAAVDYPVYDVVDHDQYLVRLAGHWVGPVVTPSSLLRDEERSWVDGMVGQYEARCCREVCDPPIVAKVAGEPAPPMSCHTECTPEGECATGFSTGLIVMVGAWTQKDCLGDCPHPADDAPAYAPECPVVEEPEPPAPDVGIDAQLPEEPDEDAGVDASPDAPDAGVDATGEEP